MRSTQCCLKLRDKTSKEQWLIIVQNNSSVSFQLFLYSLYKNKYENLKNNNQWTWTGFLHNDVK